VEAEHLRLSKVKKVELFDFMKETRNKEEYRRASAIKQKLEGLPYRTIARNLDVNYRDVYNWTKEYKEYGVDGIRRILEYKISRTRCCDSQNSAAASFVG
jgi:hypothetical protein